MHVADLMQKKVRTIAPEARTHFTAIGGNRRCRSVPSMVRYA